MTPELTSAVDAVATARTLLIATDFDGVLAPLVDDPLASRALPGTIEDLVTLAGLPGTHVALVSGRDLATLARLTGQGPESPLTLIGGHGAQSTREDIGIPLTPMEQQTLESLTEALRAALADLPGARLEFKPTATVLHTRGIDPAVAVAATGRAAEVAAGFPDVKTMLGKDVLELTPLVVDKGSALTALATTLGADAVVYLGDDRTDETVFVRLTGDDLGVKVGPGETHAAHRVADPPGVAELLTALRQARGHQA